MNMKARAVVGRGDKGLLSDATSDLRLEREKRETETAEIVDGKSTKNMKDRWRVLPRPTLVGVLDGANSG